MIKTEGKCFDQVAEYLNSRGISTEGLKIATLGFSGSDHLIMKDDDVIGEYNHTTKTVSLYADEFKMA